MTTTEASVQFHQGRPEHNRTPITNQRTVTEHETNLFPSLVFNLNARRSGDTVTARNSVIIAHTGT